MLIKRWFNDIAGLPGPPAFCTSLQTEKTHQDGPGPMLSSCCADALAVAGSCGILLSHLEQPSVAGNAQWQRHHIPRAMPAPPRASSNWNTCSSGTDDKRGGSIGEEELQMKSHSSAQETVSNSLTARAAEGLKTQQQTGAKRTSCGRRAVTHLLQRLLWSCLHISL